ncbi:MAG TPA: ASPIC/UnbV domain-containing protein [Planctomycetota bacterium]
MSDQHRPEEGIEYEEVSTDDTVIGRAFKVSMLVIGALAALGLLAWWWFNRPEEVAPAQVVTPDAPRAIQSEVKIPAVAFTDVTAASGLDFVHQNGAEGEKLLPETMGGGSAFLDRDGDGDVDLLLVNGCFWPHSTRVGEKPTQALYDGDGRGKFTNATAGSGLDASFYGMGAACADADGDGDTDAFFTAVGLNHYFENEGQRFAERDVGLSGAEDAWSTCASFFDADLDGDLDLYVGNYVRWTRAIDLEVAFSIDGTNRAYGPPTTFEGAQPYFYENTGDGRFADVTEASGLRIVNPATGVPAGKALGVRACDPDLDGDIDLIVANDTVANFYYRNEGGLAFVEKAAAMGLAFDKNGRPTGAMGIDVAWFRNDDAIAVAIGNFSNEPTSFYVTQGRASLWLDEAITSGIAAPTQKFLKFGTLFLDYDLDGRVDFLQCNGHLEEEIHKVQVSQTYEQSAQLFWNAGDEAQRPYVEVDSKTTGDLARPIVGRGSASADLDGDGDLDLLLTQSGRKPLLLRNDQALGHRWLRLLLVGKGQNQEAIGARVEVHVAGVKQCQDVMPFKSYLSQVERTLTFGLGSATLADKVVVHWPDGTQQELTGVAAGKQHRIEQAR